MASTPGMELVEDRCASGTVEVIPTMMKPASSKALAMAETEDREIFLCSTVTTDVTTLGDTHRAPSPHVSRMTDFMVDTHDGQCRLESRYDVVSLCFKCGESGVLLWGRGGARLLCRRFIGGLKRLSG